MEIWGIEIDQQSLWLLAALLVGRHLEILHQTGRERAAPEVQAPANLRYRTTPFIDAMDQALAASDIVVCRAGATMIAELAVAARPSVLIPYPHATEGHQRHNAELFERAGAAVLMDEAGASPESLAACIDELLRDDDRRADMSRAARSLAREDAADAVANEVMNAVALGSP